MPTEWVSYINKNSRRKFWNEGQYGDWFKALVKGAYMWHVDRVLFKPFESYLVGRKAHNPLHLIHSCQEDLIYHPEIEGESPVSIGEVYHVVNGNGSAENPTCGFYHVGPFGCMQETVAKVKAGQIIEARRIGAVDAVDRLHPHMDAAFGESPPPALDSKMAAFAEACKKKHDLLGSG
jgi:hypothetical protein